MRSSTWARAASRSFSRSAIPCRWVCEPAAANSGARATSDWLSSESRDAASRLGRSVLATWLKAAPKRAEGKDRHAALRERQRSDQQKPGQNGECHAVATEPGQCRRGGQASCPSVGLDRAHLPEKSAPRR